MSRRHQLASALGCAEADVALDVDLLLCHVLSWTRAQLLARDEAPVTIGQAEAVAALLQRRAAGEPIAYLLGAQEFYGHTLTVSPATLIPRPDTELLVDLALRLAPQLPTAARVADLGTGSGAIAIALAHAQPGWQLLGIDVSAAALQIAAGNVRDHALANLTLVTSNWLAAVNQRSLDLVIANPPYIAAGDPHLLDLTFEPLNALAAGAGGLDDLRAIAQAAPAHLAEGGWLLVEHGWDQAHAVRALLSAAGFSAVRSERDLAGHERATLGQLS